jgi:hypothetical protein
VKKILSIFVISLLIGLNASAEIIDLKCTWNSGFTIPNEDVSSNKGRVEFFKIDLDKKIILDSPSGGYENKKYELSYTWVHVREDTISFGINAGNDTRVHTYKIDRNTGILKENHSIKELGLISNNYLCEKTKIKKKF